MVLLKVQHSFQGLSGIARDQYVNTFHLQVASYDDAYLNGVTVSVKNFYNNGQGGSTLPIFSYLSGTADADGARVKIYDMSDAMPRSPIWDAVYNPTDMAQGFPNLPSEIACCLSYAAEPASGVPIARLRGRIYIGPLSTRCLNDAETSNDVSRPSLAFRTALVAAAEDLVAALATLDPIGFWVVHSPTTGTDHSIVRWWVDDAWDTQRRRGDAPTGRLTGAI